MTLVLLFLSAQLSAGAIVARVKEADARVHDLEAVGTMEIVFQGETKRRVFALSLLRFGVGYRALITLREPDTMAGTKFLVDASRGERNREWAYFPDLDLVRPIAGKSQEDSFLGSDLTYADLAGGAHLDDLRHRLVGEETVEGTPCYVMEGVPKHEVAYGKIVGFIRKADYENIKAVFYDHDGKPIKEARLGDIRDLGGGALVSQRIEVRSASSGSRTVLTLTDVVVNQGLSEEKFSEGSLGKR